MSKTILPKGIRRTVSHLILPAAVASLGGALWVLCHTTDIVYEPHWPAAALTAAAFSTYLLRASWKRQLKAAFQEGYADGYLRRVSDELKDVGTAR